MAGSVTETFVGKKWTLTGMRYEGRDYTLPSSDRPFIEFGKDGKLTGFGGCNNMFASYKIGFDGSFEIGPIGATRMYCEDSIDLEDRFFKSLSMARSIDVSERKLVTTSADRTAVLEFEAKS